MLTGSLTRPILFAVDFEDTQLGCLMKVFVSYTTLNTSPVAEMSWEPR